MATIMRLRRRSFSPPRQPNRVSRTREQLTADEVEQLIVATQRAGGRLAERDSLLIMMAYRHGLWASELAQLRWDQIDLKARALHVARRKNGSPSTHPLRGPELRAMRSWKRQQGEMATYVFTSLRGEPMTMRTVHHVVAEAGKAAGIKFPVHPTYYGTRRACISQTLGMTRARSNCTLAIRTSSTSCATLN